MQIDIVNTQGEVVDSANLDETVWGIAPHTAVMHQALVRQQANARIGTHETKTRGRVRGGGRKPWRQKGTGRARQGSIRSPQWRGGGVVFGPHPRKYTKDMPKKMRRLAIRSALSAKNQNDQMVVVNGLEAVEPKTRVMQETLGRLPLAGARSTLILVGSPQENIRRGAGNLDNVKVLPAQYVNMQDMLRFERLVVTQDAVDVIHQLWGQ